MPIVLMVFAFMLVLGTCYLFCYSVFYLLKRLGYIANGKAWLRISFTLFIFILLIMQSIGQLSIRDVIALILIGVVGYFYYSYIGVKKQSE